jgi:hypothetical protein
MDANFLNSINKTIGDNMRFIRDYQANPQKYASSGTSSGTGIGTTASTSGSSASDPMQVLNPMLMLMMFQMMTRMMEQMGISLPQQDLTAFQNLAGQILPGLNTASGDSSSGSISQNPAVSYLEGRFQALAEENPGVVAIPWSAEETASLQNEVIQNRLSMTQVGQALMYELDQTDTRNLPAVGQLITGLMQSGDLNIAPFLQNDYLAQLQPERGDTLYQSVESAGLRLANGAPNSRFISFLLENLSPYNPNRATQPQTQAFVQQFVQDLYNACGQNATTPNSSILAQVLNLAGITVDEQGQLIFP